MRARAIPLSLEFVQAMATIAFIRKRPQMAQALLLGFAGLLRVGKLLQARLGHFNSLRPDYMIMTLPESKGASRSGQAEFVVFSDKAPYFTTESSLN